VNGSLGAVGVDVATVVFSGLALACVLFAIRRALELVPLTGAQRDVLERVGPLVATVAVLAFSLFAARRLLGSTPANLPLVGAVVVVGFALAAWPAIRDVLSGVFLKAGRVCREGDVVRLDDIAGRVVRMGWRTIEIETPTGDHVVLPFSHVARNKLVRSGDRDALSPHTFVMPSPADLSLAEAKDTIHSSALLVHWSAVSRLPKVAPQADGSLEITVFAIDPDHHDVIEAAVRAALRAARRA